MTHEGNIVEGLYDVFTKIQEKRTKEEIKSLIMELHSVLPPKDLLSIVAGGGAIVGREIVLEGDRHFSYSISDSRNWELTGGSYQLGLKPGKYRINLIFERVGDEPALNEA